MNADVRLPPLNMIPKATSRAVSLLSVADLTKTERVDLLASKNDQFAVLCMDGPGMRLPNILTLKEGSFIEEKATGEKETLPSNFKMRNSFRPENGIPISHLWVPVELKRFFAMA